MGENLIKIIVSWVITYLAQATIGQVAIPGGARFSIWSIQCLVKQREARVFRVVIFAVIFVVKAMGIGFWTIIGFFGRVGVSQLFFARIPDGRWFDEEAEDVNLF